MYANPCMVSDRMRKTQYTSKIYHYHNHRHYDHHQHRIHSFGYFAVHFISHLNKLSIQSISGLPLFLLLLNFVEGHAMHCVNSVNWYFHCLTIRPYILCILFTSPSHASQSVGVVSLPISCRTSSFSHLRWS